MCREIGANTASRYSQVKGIYGSRSFVEDLDIINELTGHSGCVNALRFVALSIMCWDKVDSSPIAGLAQADYLLQDPTTR